MAEIFPKLSAAQRPASCILEPGQVRHCAQTVLSHSDEWWVGAWDIKMTAVTPPAVDLRAGIMEPCGAQFGGVSRRRVVFSKLCMHFVHAFCAHFAVRICCSCVLCAFRRAHLLCMHFVRISPCAFRRSQFVAVCIASHMRGGSLLLTLHVLWWRAVATQISFDRNLVPTLHSLLQQSGCNILTASAVASPTAHSHESDVRISGWKR